MTTATAPPSHPAWLTGPRVYRRDLRWRDLQEKFIAEHRDIESAAEALVRRLAVAHLMAELEHQYEIG